MTELSAAQNMRPTILDIYFSIRKYRLVLFLAFLFSTIISIALAFLLPPTYRSEVILAPAEMLDNNSKTAGALSAFTALRSLSGPRTDGSVEALAILESRRFSAQFILKHNLISDLVPELETTNPTALQSTAALEDAVMRFDRDVRSITVDDETGFVRLRIDWRSSALAQKWAEALVNDLNLEMRERAILEAQTDLGYLEEKLRESQIPEIRASLANLVQNRMESIMLATNRPNYAFKVIDPATRSKYRYQPRRALLIAGGALLGFLLGLALVAILTTLSRLRAAI